MNVTLRQLRVFIEVARLQSFSRAGDEIGLTQSAVSRCVRELEGEIGLKLIDRTTREVQLTDVGGNLVSSVSRLLTDLDDALREIREIGEQRRGRVVVAASPTVACRLMPRVVASCVQQFPLYRAGPARRRAERRGAQGEVGRGRFRRDHRAVFRRRPAQRIADDGFVLRRLARRSPAGGAGTRGVGGPRRRAARDARLRVGQPADHRRRDAGIWRERRRWCRNWGIPRPFLGWSKRASA